MSQIAAHAPFGGVVPEIAARAHVEIIDLLIARALKRAQVAARDLDGVAAAAGPGLIGGVLVGLMAGKGVALACGKPFVAVNHLEAHALTARLTEQRRLPLSRAHRLGRAYADPRGQGRRRLRPARRDHGRRHRRSVRQDRQTAGAALSRRASGRGGGGRRRSRRDSRCRGLCSAGRTPIFRCPGSKRRCVLRRNPSRPLRPRDVADLCASFQAAVVDVVEDRIRVGLKLFRRRIGVAPRAVVVAGGVAANRALREALTRFCAEAGLPLVAPPQKLCTDNGAMIAWAGVERLQARNDRRARRAGPAALAARSQIRARAQQQGLKRCRTGRSLSVGLGRRARPCAGACRSLLLRLFVGEVMADDAAADRADDPVMAGVMAGDAADHRALQTALGLSGSGRLASRTPARERTAAMIAYFMNSVPLFPRA